jgi:glycosyltransferase involved in cell wall biosynthesis
MGTPRIACVGTHGGAEGGAAIAMLRLVASLRANGLETAIVSLHRPDGRDPHISRSHPRHGDAAAAAKRVRRIIKHGRSSLTNTLFTADWPAWDVSLHPEIRAADVVNLHWVAGFLNGGSVRRIVESGKPVVWTLHDQRAFTGGCHYTGGCDGFTRDCDACPQLQPALRETAQRTLRRSRSAVAGLPITFVTPSEWLSRELQRGSLYDPDHHDVRVIPYDIDTGIFAPVADKRVVRRKLGLPIEGLAIALGSVSLGEERKGARQAKAALERMVASLRDAGYAGDPPFVVTYGQGTLAPDGVASHDLGSHDESGVRDILNACDVYLTMTREDNLPNTVMEALACGIPVVGTRVGGVPDMVEHGAQGWLVDRDDSLAAGETLASLVQRPGALTAMGRAAREKCLHLYAPGTQGRRYGELFRSLAERPRSARSGGSPSVAQSSRDGGADGVADVLGITAASGRLLARRRPLRPHLRFIRRLLAG